MADHIRGQALERMRRHMAEDKSIKIERGRYGWTKYPRSHVAFSSIGGFLVLSEPCSTIGQKPKTSSPTTKNTCEPTCSLKQDTEA